jgi:predicted nuclease of predicted toxin-antitoxin system
MPRTWRARGSSPFLADPCLKFKIDENMPEEVAELLRSAGHDAVSVLDQNLGGWADPGVAEVCRSEGRVVVTLDVGFADMRSYPPQDYAGLIVLRLKRQDKPAILKSFSRAMRLLPLEPVAGALWIVEEDRVRIRR